MSRRRAPRPMPLAAGLAAALGVASCAGFAEICGASPSEQWTAVDWTVQQAFPSDATHPTGATHIVDTCADDGSPGSLRMLIESPDTHSGDTIDLSQLTCSTITLGSGWADPSIEIAQDTLYLKGPGAKYLTVDGGNHTRVFKHSGAGTLNISNLTIADGYYVSDSSAAGGCIYSSGSVDLMASAVEHCIVGSAGTRGVGGAIYTRSNLALFASTITNARAFSIGHVALGGAVFSKAALYSLYSTVSDSTAYAIGGESYAGGIYVVGPIQITKSTISGNQADNGGGLELEGGFTYLSAITDSTISGNVALAKFGGIHTRVPLTLANSTIAFNEAGYDSRRGAGLYSNGAPLVLQSSILSDNLENGMPGDLGARTPVPISGASNLVVATSLDLPHDTIVASPHLKPLADNCGPTRTHALSDDSPAINKGNNDRTPPLSFDQRGQPRVSGPHADIGAFEWQPRDAEDTLLFDDFDGSCPLF